MNENLSSFKERIIKQRVAVIGLGASNTSLVEYLGKLGVNLTVFDQGTREDLKDRIEAVKDYNIDFCLGGHQLSRLKGFDVIFKTPVIRPDIPELSEEQKNGAVVTSVMEVFFDLCPAEIFAVTGSDGKTTTSAIIYEFLKEAGYHCLLGGNTGTPLLSRIDEVRPEHKIVLELSSFQLMTMKKSPQEAVITNIFPNHLDMYKSMEEYLEAKKNIYRYQDGNGLLVLNYDNGITRGLATEAPGRTVYFSRTCELESGAFLKDDLLCFRENDKASEILQQKDILLPGNHNVENYLAAIAATRAYANTDAVARAASALSPMEHRMEFVREIGGVRYYDDSMGSSPSRTMAALNAFDGRVVLIAGGYDKNLSYDPMGDVLVEKVKHLILMGQTASMIEMALMRKVIGKYRGMNIRITHCSTLKQAVDCASLSARPGDIVLLSPASAGFELFKDFNERGNLFKDYVNEL